MKKKIFLVVALFCLLTLPHTNLDAQDGSLTPEEREELLEKYKVAKERLNYLRWYVQKFDLKKRLDAGSYLVIDLEDDNALLERNSSYSYPIASITKLMSAVVAVENLDMDKEIAITDAMLGHNRTSPALTRGTVVTARDLMKASLIQSTNDACEALTYFMEEGEFVSLMNEKAREIGITGSRFYDAHGLARSNNTPLPENMSSSRDIAKLLKYINEEHPKILEITRDDNFQLPGNCPEYEGICTFLNRNLFHGIESFVGGKTGYLGSISRLTFTGIFEVEENPFLVVLLYSNDRRGDTEKIYEWLSENPSLEASQKIIKPEIKQN